MSLTELDGDPASRKARQKAWQDLGTLSARAVMALTVAGCDSANDIRRLGRDAFEDIANCGDKTLREIGAFIGGWPSDFLSAPENIILAIFPDTFPTADRVHIAATIAAGLERCGYAIVSRKMG